MHPRAEPLSLRGRWLAITAATAVYQFAYWPILAGVAPPEGAGAGLVALGLALIPFVFLTAAFGSRHRNAPGASLRAMGWFLFVGVPIGLLAAPLGVAIGVSLGAAASLAPLERIDTRRARYWTVLGVAAYLLLLLLLSPGFAVISGAVLPIAVHGVVDQTLEERDLQRERRERHATNG